MADRWRIFDFQGEPTFIDSINLHAPLCERPDFAVTSYISRVRPLSLGIPDPSLSPTLALARERPALSPGIIPLVR